MRTRMRKRICLLIVLLPFFWGCRDLLVELAHQGEAVAQEGMVPVSIVLGDGSAPSRTIAPGHLTAANLQNYTFELTGSSDMGGTVSIPNFTLANGLGEVLLSPGNWRLRLTATFAGTLALAGGTTLTVTGTPTSASITLSPVASGTGTVRIEFTLAEATVSRLDAQQITVALYDSSLNAPVAGTQQVIPVTGGTVATYTANGTQVPAGKYTVRMESPYTIQNASTRDLPVTYKVGWQDVLYVEAGRESAASVSLDSMGAAIGVPGKPVNKSKANASRTVSGSGQTGVETFSANNITGTTQTFNPYGDGLWFYAANWDGSGSNRGDQGTAPDGNGTWGNEVMLLTWDPVFDADHYEVEILLHPRYGYLHNARVSNGSKYEKLPTTDAEWDDFLTRQPRPIELIFSGSPHDPYYYRTARWPRTIYMRDGTTPDKDFTFVAWREIVLDANPGYSIANASTNNNYLGAPDPNTGLTFFRFNNTSYRIGLEGDCNALAILFNSYIPMHWYGIRMRSVSRFGESDWIYWKGGFN